MRLLGAALVAGTAVVMSACAAKMEEVSTGSVATSATPGPRWSASLAPMSGTNVTGSATVTPGDNSNQTRVDLMVSGASAGGVHPWHVHRGQCGNDQGIVGPANAYPAVAIGADGTGRVLATIPARLESGGQYMVNVHQSPQEMGTIVSCGNLGGL